MKAIPLHSLLFIQILGYASCVEESFVLKKDTLVPKQGLEIVFEEPMLPTYPGGDAQLVKDLYDNLVYPKLEKSKGIQGTVYIQFYVETNGSMSEIIVVRGIKDGKNLDKAALQAVKKLKRFIPAKNHNGEPIKQMLTIPVRFKLPESTDIKQNNKP